MRHLAMATITLPVVASFEDDGVHSLDVQAEEALKIEAIGEYCLLWDVGYAIKNIQVSPADE